MEAEEEVDLTYHALGRPAEWVLLGRQVAAAERTHDQIMAGRARHQSRSTRDLAGRIGLPECPT